MSSDSRYSRDDAAGFDFELPRIPDGSASLTGQLAGKRGIVIVFWSSVCSHCVRYDPYLNDFASRHPDLAFLAVAARKHESAGQLASAVAARHLRFTLLHDADRTVAHQWRIRQTPTALLLDPDLRVIYRGAIDNFKYPRDPDCEPYLEEAIVAFLKGEVPARPETASFGCPIESVYYDLPKPLDLPLRGKIK